MQGQVGTTAGEEAAAEQILYGVTAWCTPGGCPAVGYPDGKVQAVGCQRLVQARVTLLRLHAQQDAVSQYGWLCPSSTAALGLCDPHGQRLSCLCAQHLAVLPAKGPLHIGICMPLSPRGPCLVTAGACMSFLLQHPMVPNRPAAHLIAGSVRSFGSCTSLCPVWCYMPVGRAGQVHDAASGSWGTKGQAQT